MEYKKYKRRVFINLSVLVLTTICIFIFVFNFGFNVLSNGTSTEKIFIQGELINSITFDTDDKICNIPTRFRGKDIACVSRITGENVEELVIPKEIKAIGIHGLTLPKLKKVTLSPDNGHLIYEDGILYSKDKQYIYLINNQEEVKEIVVPLTVKEMNNIIHKGNLVEFYIDNPIPPLTNFKECDEVYYVPEHLFGMYGKSYFGPSVSGRIKIDNGGET